MDNSKFDWKLAALFATGAFIVFCAAGTLEARGEEVWATREHIEEMIKHEPEALKPIHKSRLLGPVMSFHDMRKGKRLTGKISIRTDARGRATVMATDDAGWVTKVPDRIDSMTYEDWEGGR